MTKLDISIVIPLLNEEESLPELNAWIKKVMDTNGFSYEVIFIDDGSTDKSWEVVSQLSSKNDEVKGIRFNRNYGKSAALHVGFQETLGNVVFTMDADLQDSPEELPSMYRMIIEDGYDLVSGWKKKRFDPLTKTIPTKLYNATTRFLSGIKLNDMNCGLKAYKGEVVKSIEVYGEMHRYIPVIAKYAGYKKIGEKVVEHQARKYGSTKFGLERFINGPLDLMSIMFVMRFKRRPMHFFGTIGTFSFVTGIFITLFLIGQKLYHVFNASRAAREVVDQPLFYLALVAIIMGVQMFLAGFLGEMIGRNSSNRNEYLVREKIKV